MSFLKRHRINARVLRFVRMTIHHDNTFQLSDSPISTSTATPRDPRRPLEPSMTPHGLRHGKGLKPPRGLKITPISNPISSLFSAACDPGIISSSASRGNPNLSRHPPRRLRDRWKIPMTSSMATRSAENPPAHTGLLIGLAPPGAQLTSKGRTAVFSTWAHRVPSKRTHSAAALPPGPKFRGCVHYRRRAVDPLRSFL